MRPKLNSSVLVASLRISRTTQTTTAATLVIGPNVNVEGLIIHLHLLIQMKKTQILSIAPTSTLYFRPATSSSLCMLHGSALGMIYSNMMPMRTITPPRGLRMTRPSHKVSSKTFSTFFRRGSRHKLCSRGGFDDRLVSLTFHSIILTRNQFINGLNAQRYNTTTRIRHQCASILGVSENDLLKADVRRDKFREQIGWVNETGLYSSVDVPILHKDWNGQYSLSSIFLNPKLMGVKSFIFHTYLQ